MSESDKSEIELSELGLMSPKAAQTQLRTAGIYPIEYQTILGKRGLGADGLHTFKALVTIALGSEPRKIGEVIKEIRVRDGLSPEPKDK